MLTCCEKKRAKYSRYVEDATAMLLLCARKVQKTYLTMCHELRNFFLKKVLFNPHKIALRLRPNDGDIAIEVLVRNLAENK